MNNMKQAAYDKHLKEHQNYLKTISRMAVADKKTACNIIMILMDDLGWGDLSCFGSEAIHTPHLDCLAEEGIVLGKRLFFQPGLHTQPGLAY